MSQPQPLTTPGILTAVSAIKQTLAAQVNMENPEEVIADIGGKTITVQDLLDNREEIQNFYGYFNVGPVIGYLTVLQHISNRGGELYRVLFLNDASDIDDKHLGKHWVSDESQLDMLNSGLRPAGMQDTYRVTVTTPPGNVSLPYDYFSNMEEQEIMVVDDTLLTLVEIKQI